MNNLEKLSKLTEYHNYLKGATKFDLSVLEEIMGELLGTIDEENKSREVSYKRIINYLDTQNKK